uniref:T-cell immunoreceptor with Ig and ITIM domains-like n=1 Tax=Gasterosteus aculeatus aculeatus TaxID=481459 RepID=UPI001A9803AF|nr:T-cell immunoreceptor with Ig and ITIM domains-like [Gasterosteus aculeatus aculeatus]
MRVTVSMSALHLKLVTTFCLCCTALSGPGSSGVEWKDVGGNVTIGCRPPGEGQTTLSLWKSEAQILYVHGKSRKETIASEFSGRLQLTGEFPDIDIIIKNLTSDDTGAYWCKYNTELVLGKGSVLLVVTESPDNAEAEQEEPEQPKDSPQPSAPSGDANAAAGGRRNPPGGKSSLILG